MDCLKESLKGIEQNVSLAPHTTFQIGGKARYFFKARSVQDVIKAVLAAKDCRVPFFVLAGGSNVLIADKGFQGLVILLEMKKWSIAASKVTAEAGVDVETLVEETGKRGLSGFEWAGGLPGSVGGAVRGNAGAFAGEIKDNLASAIALDDKGNVRKVPLKDCKFSYRNSFFKKKGWIVLSAEFRVKKGDKKKIQEIARSHVAYRKERHPLEYPNAGSMFKNCDLKKFSPKQQRELQHVVKVDPFPVVPTAYLISEASLKGLRVGNAEVSKKHPNYVVNLGGARADDVLQLLQEVKQAVKKKFSVELEEEVQYVS